MNRDLSQADVDNRVDKRCRRSRMPAPVRFGRKCLFSRRRTNVYRRLLEGARGGPVGRLDAAERLRVVKGACGSMPSGL